MTLTRPFTTDEVWRRLKSASNTAPGADGLRYPAWRALDPGALLLTPIFNWCAVHNRVPTAWKASSTVLLHKDGPLHDPSSWRPIALSPTIAKLYAGLWADRLSRWSDTSDLLSPNQKGFRHFDGVLEHNFVLQNAINDARRSRSELHVLFVDVSNAFGSVPHAYLWDVLFRMGLPPDVLLTLKDLYEGSTTEYRTEAGPPVTATVTRGVRQGCPLSGILFALAIDPVVKSLEAVEGVSPLAFADDLALCCSSRTALLEACGVLERISGWCGLTLNARKSGLLSVRSPPQPLTLCGNPVPTITAPDAYRYLGRPVGHTRAASPPLHVLEETQRHAILVLDSALAPWQKLDALRSFILPRLTHSLRLGVLPKHALKAFDTDLRWRVKGVLNLPPNASAQYLYAPTSQGCIGLTELAIEADVLMVAATWQLLTSPDPAVLDEARDQLITVVRKRLRAEPSPDQLAAYLNSEPMLDGGDVSTRFSRARVATKHLEKQGVPLLWKAVDDEVVLTLRDLVVPRAKAAALLRDAVRARAAARLTSLPHQGKVMAAVGDQRVSSHYAYNGSFTRFAEWRFVHRARLGLVPLNAVRRGPQRNSDERCRRCGYVRETLPHVLCHCMRNGAAYQRRHNALVERLAGALRGRPGTEIRLNRTVPNTLSPLRPDLTVTRGNETILVDVTVPFENGPDALQAAHDAKITKYTPLVEELRAAGRVASVAALVVGSLGTWWRGSEAVLRALRIPKSYSRLMRKLMVSDTLRWSRDVYIEHITGARQYQ